MLPSTLNVEGLSIPSISFYKQVILSGTHHCHSDISGEKMEQVPNSAYKTVDDAIEFYIRKHWPSEVVVTFNYLLGINGEMVVKELGIHDVITENEQVFSFKSPYPYKLDPESSSSKKNKYLINHVHDLNWESGLIEYSEMQNILKKYVGNAEIVVGECEKSILFLEKILDRSVMEIDFYLIDCSREDADWIRFEPNRNACLDSHSCDRNELAHVGPACALTRAKYFGDMARRHHDNALYEKVKRKYLTPHYMQYTKKPECYNKNCPVCNKIDDEIYVNCCYRQYESDSD